MWGPPFIFENYKLFSITILLNCLVYSSFYSLHMKLREMFSIREDLNSQQFCFYTLNKLLKLTIVSTYHIIVCFILPNRKANTIYIFSFSKYRPILR